MALRILIITPYYYPYINPRAFRWTQIAEQWADQGLEVHVVCSRRSGWPDEGLHQGVHLHRVGYNSLKEVLYNTVGSARRRGESGAGPVSESSWSRLVIWLNKYFWKSIYWPDDAVLWIKPAKAQALKLAQEMLPDLLISTSLPFSAHLVGKALKEKFPDLPWIVDIGDPFSFQELHPLNNQFWYRQKNRRAEQQVFEQADAVAVTNPGAKELYRKHFPQQDHKVQVIPPLTIGFPLEKFVPVGTGPIRIGYFGSFFPGLREPLAFLPFFDQFSQAYPRFFEQVELHFFGDLFEDMARQFQRFPKLREQCRFHGLVSRAAAFQQMQGCDFLLHLGNRSTFQLPSKCPDYLQAGRPILQFSYLENDSSKAFFGKLEGWKEVLVQAVYSEQEVEEVYQFLADLRGWALSLAAREERVRAFLPEQVAEAYLLVIKD